jgi:hypothetical protein
MYPVRTLDDHFLHVAADDRHARSFELGVDEIKEFSDVSHELLADAFACAVDGELQ